MNEQAKSRRRREPTFLLVSAAPTKEEDGDGSWTMPYPAEELLFWAWQSWEGEVSHREMKGSFGLGEIQSWGALSAVMALRWQAWAYGVMVLAGMRAWGLGKGPASVRPPGRWWGGSGRWSMGTLWRGYRSELWGLEGFRALWTATGDDYYEKEALLGGLSNSVMGSMRA